MDPLDVTIAQAVEALALVFAESNPARIAHARQVLPALENRRCARPELQAGRLSSRLAWVTPVRRSSGGCLPPATP